MTLLAFARQSTGAQEFSGERLLNWYAQPWPDGGIGALRILPSPGLARHVLLSDGKPVRALLAAQDALYAACGGKLWKVAAGVATALGSIPDAPTTLATNGLQVAVAAGGRYFVWTGANLAEPAAGAFSDVGSVAALDGYILLFEETGQRFSITALNDATTIDALDFASAEGAPDYLMRGHVDHAEVWLFGSKTVELWGNAGGADFPFSRFQGGNIQRGLAFAGAVASEDSGVFFVGDDRAVYRGAAGGSPRRVSTPAVESALRSATDALMFTFTLDGQKCVAVRLPDRPAWVFDLGSGLWHERGGADGWIATCTARFGGVEYVGTAKGSVCTFGGLTDDGDMILREAISLPMNRGTDWISLHEVAVTMQTGRTDLGRVPVAMLEHSTDGRTWGRVRSQPLGAFGSYSRTLRWHGFGRGRQHRVRLRVTDPVDTAIYGASYRAT